MKSYYSCLDVAFVKYVPQRLQHLAIADKAGKLDGQVSFYTMEDFKTLSKQLSLRAKLEEQPPIEGIIYFTLRQFCYGSGLDLKMLRLILGKGYEVHFAREDISIPDLESLDQVFPMLYSAQVLWERDDNRDNWHPVWNTLGQVPVSS